MRPTSESTLLPILH